jgi:hypothetical protein
MNLSHGHSNVCIVSVGNLLLPYLLFRCSCTKNENTLRRFMHVLCEDSGSIAERRRSLSDSLKPRQQGEVHAKCS